MKRGNLFGWVCLIGALATSVCRAESDTNVLIIYADDLGFGDVQANNPDRGKIPTPAMNQFARESMRFTDAHSSSGCCSPSRYTLLTGRYHWRTSLQSGIVPLWGKPLIHEDRLTLGKMAQQHGYRTACVGKWHLGIDWQIAKSQMSHFTGFGGKSGGGGDQVQREPSDENRAVWKQVFSQPFKAGPVTRGFDEYFGTEVPNWPPYCFLRNDQTVGIPNDFLAIEGLAKYQASFQGPALEGWKLDAILPALVEETQGFITKRAQDTKPFLLYLALTSPHTPLAVNREWKGKSGLNSEYADMVMETDAAIGKVLKSLSDCGLAEKTLVLLTSDNGCASYIGVPALEAQGHFPSGPLRDYKASAYEGGHRIPFMIRWPGVVQPNSVCKQLVHQADLFATIAELLGHTVPDNAGEDSFSLMSLLKGNDQPVRQHAVSTACQGQPTFRDGTWKLVLGVGKKTDGAPPEPQLFNLADDLAEQKNLAIENHARVSTMLKAYESIIVKGRSTPGPKQKNDVPVKRYVRN